MSPAHGIEPIDLDAPAGEDCIRIRPCDRSTVILSPAKAERITDGEMMAQLIDALRDVLPTAHSFYRCTGGRKPHEGKHLDDAEAVLLKAQTYIGDKP